MLDRYKGENETTIARLLLMVCDVGMIMFALPIGLVGMIEEIIR